MQRNTMARHQDTTIILQATATPSHIIYVSTSLQFNTRYQPAPMPKLFNRREQDSCSLKQDGLLFATMLQKDKC